MTNATTDTPVYDQLTLDRLAVTGHLPVGIVGATPADVAALAEFGAGLVDGIQLDSTAAEQFDAEPEPEIVPEPVECREAADWNAPGLRNWTGPVGGYPNRQPPWPPGAFRRFDRTMRISVQTAPGWAELCREIDVESGAAGVADIPPFVLARESFGHHDATAYFSIDRWPAVLPVLNSAGITPERLRLNIAWWTGNPTRIDLGGGWIAWGHQFDSDLALNVTRTMVFGKQDFYDPRK